MSAPTGLDLPLHGRLSAVDVASCRAAADGPSRIGGGRDPGAVRARARAIASGPARAGLARSVP